MKAEKYVVKNTAGMFDFIKGIAMFIVIFVHTYALFPKSAGIVEIRGSRIIFAASVGITVRIFRAIYSVIAHAMMPALFAISGYGFRKTTLKKNAEKQFKGIMIPYIVTMFLTALLHLCTHFTLYRYLKGSLIETLRIFGGSFLGLPKTSYYWGVKIFSNGPNWFLLALFVGMLVFNFLLNKFEGKILLVAVIAVSTVGWLLSLLPFTVPWCIPQGLASVFYIYLGYYAKKSKLFIEGIDTRKKILYAIFIVIPSVTIRVLGYMDGMADGVYPFGILTILLNGMFCLSIIYLFLQVNRTNRIVTSSIRTLGRYSIYILCIHTMEMMGFPLYYFVEKWKGNVVAGEALFTVVRFTVVALTCFLFIKIKNAVVSWMEKKKEKTENV